MTIESDRRSIEQIARDAGIEIADLDGRSIDAAPDSALLRMRAARPALFDAFMEKHGAAIAELGMGRVEQALTVAFYDGYYLLMTDRCRIEELMKHGVLPGERVEEAAMHLLESCFEQDPSLLDHTIKMAGRTLEVRSLPSWKIGLDKAVKAWADDKLGKEDPLPAKKTKGDRRNGHVSQAGAEAVPVLVSIDREAIIGMIASVLQMPEDDVAGCMRRHKYFESIKGGRATDPAALVSLMEKAVLVMGRGYGVLLAQRASSIFISRDEASNLDHCLDGVWQGIARMPEVERNANGTTDAAEANRRKRAEVGKVLDKWNSGTRKGLAVDRQSIQSFADLMTDVVELRRGIARLPRFDLLLPSDPYVYRDPYSSPAPLRDLRLELSNLYREHGCEIERTPLTAVGIDKVWVFGARLDASIQEALREAFPEIRRANWRFQDQHFINPSDIPKNPQPGVLAVWIPVFGGHTEMDLLEGPIRKTPNAHFVRIRGRNATVLEHRIREFAEGLR